MRRQLTNKEYSLLNGDWAFSAREEQLPPDGDWFIWLFLGGRGAGKTRAGAEWVAERVRAGHARRVALIAATHSDARRVMIEGDSGLLRFAGGAEYFPSNRLIHWPASGAKAFVLSAEEPDSIRGYQFDTAWADEFCKWPDAQAALDMVLMGLRVGESKMMISTTPRPIPSLKALIARDDCRTTRSATRDNAINLSRGYMKSMEAAYRGTRLGRQELDGEIIEDVEGAAWQRDWIEKARVKSAPAELDRIVVGVDPPANRGECGIVVAGVKKAGDPLSTAGFVLADRSKENLSPARWAARVADAYAEFGAACVVAEANQGGRMVQETLLRAHPNMKVMLVHASVGKKARAVPIAALYETGRVHHVGLLATLEDQMCSYDGSGPSPDRMDALVWALTELFPQRRIAIPRVTVM